MNPDGVRKAGPLIHNWARRASRAMPSTRRQLIAVHKYLSDPNGDKAVQMSMGGGAVLEWVGNTLDGLEPDDFPDTRNENEIDVLGLPYGGPNGGKDSQGEFFDENTDFLDGEIDHPPVFYTHGTQNGFDTVPVGKIKRRRYDSQGGWFRVELDPLNPRYPQLVEAFNKGKLYASSGVVPASYLASNDGHIDSWLVGELSLIDTTNGYVPINRYAITKSGTGTKAETFTFEDYFGDNVTGIEEQDTWLQSVKAALNNLMTLIGARPCSLPVTTMPDSPIIKANYGGRERSELDDSDFALPDERKFPIITQSDLDDAVHLIGNYKGPSSEETIRAGIRRLAKKHNLTLPDSWSKSMPDEPKCATCEEAARLKAEISNFVTSRPACVRCSEAMNWVKAQVVAGKLDPTRAFELIDKFTASDDEFDAIRAQVEVVVGVPGIGTGLKATPIEQISVAGGRGTPSDPQALIDEDWVKKQLANSGIHEVKV